MRLFKGLTGLVVLMLLATGCFRVEGNIVVEDDGSGTIDLLSAVKADVGGFGLDDLAEADIGSGDLCDAVASDLPDPADFPAGATVTPYDEDGFCGVRLSLGLPPSTNHDAAVSEVFQGSSELNKQGDNWILRIELDAEEFGLDTGGFELGDEGESDFFTDALLGDASFTFSARLPGRPVDGAHNATSVDGNRFNWDIDFQNPPATLFAQTEPGSAGSSSDTNWLLIGLVVAGLLALAVIGWLVLSKRGAKSAAPSQAAGPASTVGMGDAEAATTQTTAMPQATDPASEAIPSSSESSQPTPVYDDALGAWVIDDPAQGRLRHDPATDTWRRLH